MLTFRLDLDLDQSLVTAAGRQLPFALSKALNDSATLFQTAQRRGMGEHFTLRRRAFAEQSVKITHFATKSQLFAEVAIRPPGGDAKADIFTKFERGGEKRPRRGGRSLAVPVDVKRNKSDIVAKRERPRAFAFTRASSNVHTRIERYQGARRTFMIRLPDGGGWIFRRTGPGAHGSLFEGTSVLYRLTPSADLDERLGFFDTANRVVPRAFPLAFRANLARALASAR